MDDPISNILKKYPFLSYGTLQDKQYLGIIQNSDAQLLSMYIIDSIPSADLRKEFLLCGQIWWWDSNRQVPINIFLKERFRPFRPYLKHFSRKDFQLESGPAVSLQETIARRVRKRQITLLRTMPL